MRFFEKNVNGQCLFCNSFQEGNRQGYQVGLVRKYGATILRELEVKRSIKSDKWGVFEFEVMIKSYKEKVKKLEAEC
jgi:hypothetical protein